MSNEGIGIKDIQSDASKKTTYSSTNSDTVPAGVATSAAIISRSKLS